MRLPAAAGGTASAPIGASLALLALVGLTGNARGGQPSGRSLEFLSEAPIPDVFAGCGERKNRVASQRYALINSEMHAGMAINFTADANYDFVAGMVPHHTAAVDMCNVYYAAATAGADFNLGIDSLCYNITYGPVAMGEWQYDFSQPGENEQMMDAIGLMGMNEHYEAGCSALSDAEREGLAFSMDAFLGAGGPPPPGGAGTRAKYVDGGSLFDQGKAPLGQHYHDDMFMGCGKLDHPQTKEYLQMMMDMHMRMAFEWTGDPSVDFLLGMIPHHEGAIEMCEIYYRHWQCAPAREVCVAPLELDEVSRKIGDGEEVDVLNLLHHVCTGHILYVQPQEVQWMKKELGRISPEALRKYEEDKARGGYPCEGVIDAEDMHFVVGGDGDGTGADSSGSRLLLASRFVAGLGVVAALVVQFAC